MEDQYYTFTNYMSFNDLSASEEDYVEMIYRLCLINNGFARVNDIANLLNVTPPSVTKMLKKLREAGIIDYKRYGRIRLTNKGYDIGKFLLKRHNTVRKFLELINIKGDVHRETEKIEHTVSKDTINGLKVLTDFFHSNPDIMNEFQQMLIDNK